jgi:hypothetical protein
MNLFELQPYDNPGKDSDIACLFKRFVSGPRVFEESNAFANPEFLVTATIPSGEFFKKAHEAQLKWIIRLNTIFGSRGHAKRVSKRMSPIIRQLSFTGVMIVDGRHHFSNKWPNKKGRR